MTSICVRVLVHMIWIDVINHDCGAQESSGVFYVPRTTGLRGRPKEVLQGANRAGRGALNRMLERT